MLDIAQNDARPVRLPDARGPPFPLPPSHGHTQNLDLISKSPGWGGARENSGGARAGAGRPRNSPVLATPPEVKFRWYVVRTVYGQTDIADGEIREAGFEVVTARICRPATRARRSASGSLIRAREEHFDPLFVRYVIVRFTLADPSWREILGCEGVERIISGNHLSNGGVGIPISVPDKAIEGLRQVLRESRPRFSGSGSLPQGVWYPPGYRVRTDDHDPIEVDTALHLADDGSPLAGIAGVCASGDGARISMLMDWFNRPGSVPTNVARTAVEAN